MTGFLLVAAGGAVGASARYAATLLMRPGSGTFPWYTLGVNVVGSFLLGLLMALLPEGDAGERLRLLLGVGVLGGFTTFSAFSVDALTLAQQQEEFCFLALRTRGGISHRQFRANFGVELWQRYAFVLEQLLVEGLVEKQRGRTCLTSLGMRFGNRAFAAFLETESDSKSDEK